ncbi:ATP-binding protein [Consotaella salsifontis]|uniref:histidine kinase n=1 Tax=Consotaella salsifontis TaxID=1365950 RepID=A0A1T4MD67_9HYPH|nr:ATP-binding protein [Consotaella salsifontis]SJZ64704.1 Signal transduction histidine kinase [Consotaella salsifontis]
MRIRQADSLTVRVVGLSTLWAVAAFIVIGGLISTLYRDSASRAFQDLLVAQLYNLVNSVQASPTGELEGAPELGDLRYLQPLSGWYWEVLPASDNTSGRLASRSLGAENIPSMPLSQVPFGEQYRRQYQTEGPQGQLLQIVETEVLLDTENHVARFRVMGDTGAFGADVEEFSRSLAIYLGIFGLGSILINALAILFGLRPLRRVRRSLANVRAGRAERLEGSFPAEIQPLATELNALVENNRRIIERARTRVGNLAHSLKTPIAVLMNEAKAVGGEHGRLIADQSEAMRVQVQHHLDRARMAAQSEGSVFRTPVRPVLERLLRVIAKLNPRLAVELDFNGGEDLVFAGEQQDLEEIIGNLMDNAAKWGRATVRVAARAVDDRSFEILVQDDGKGLTEVEIAEAMKRGRRLDEARPGSGLGLSIVSDIVAEYRGTLSLSRSSLGGLSATVRLPRALGASVS